MRENWVGSVLICTVFSEFIMKADEPEQQTNSLCLSLNNSFFTWNES